MVERLFFAGLVLALAIVIVCACAILVAFTLETFGIDVTPAMDFTR